MTFQNKKHNVSAKITFVGDVATGKSSIIRRFHTDTFESGYGATIGVDYVKNIVNVHENSIRLDLWDTAGQDRFKTIIPIYIKDSKISILVFDITSRSTYDSISQWVHILNNNRNEDSILILVGNKTDIEAKRVITKEEGHKKCEEIKAQFYIETSAKSGHNIEELFQTIAEIELNKQKPSQATPNSSQSTNVRVKGSIQCDKGHSKKKCC